MASCEDKEIASVRARLSEFDAEGSTLTARLKDPYVASFSSSADAPGARARSSIAFRPLSRHFHVSAPLSKVAVLERDVESANGPSAESIIYVSASREALANHPVGLVRKNGGASHNTGT